MSRVNNTIYTTCNYFTIPVQTIAIYNNGIARLFYNYLDYTR